MVMFRASGSMLLLALVVGCSEGERPITELVLVADTNLPNVDEIRFEVVSTADPSLRQTKSRVPDGTPSFLSVVRDEGPLGPLDVTARALVKGVSQLSRTHRVSFVRNQTRVVALHLFAECVALKCQDACDGSSCVPTELGADDLTGWSGEPPRIDAVEIDAGAGEAGMSTVTDAGQQDAAPEGGTGTGGGGDAGTLVADAGATPYYCGAFSGWVDLKSDPEHCGTCTNECTEALLGSNATRICRQGTCDYACLPGWGNCDGYALYNGCEAPLNTVQRCGSCTNSCGEGQKCANGTCVPE